jgi:hypothetical protein
MSEEMYKDLGEAAEQHETSKTAMVKRYIKLGLMVEEPGNVHIFKAENGDLKKVVFL